MALPTPKYLRAKKPVNANPEIIPRRVLEKRVDIVNKIARKISTKKSSSIPVISGSPK